MFKQIIRNKRSRRLLTKVLTSPGHLLNSFLVLIAYKLRWQKVPGQPVVIDIEPINTCNFKCPHCTVGYGKATIKHLEEDELEAILNNFPHALRIKLQGMGEPFLNTAMHKLITLTASRDVWCEVVTNGSVLDVEKLRSLEQFANFQLTVSIDAADQASFERIRPGSSFQKIIDKVETLAKETKLNIAAWMVVSEENKDQAEEVIKLMSAIKVPVLGLQMILVDYGREVLKPETVGKRVRSENLGAYYDSLRKCASQSGTRLSISDKLYSKKHPCPWPWMGAFVDVSGNIVPCCRIGDASIYSMGNLKEVAFDAIWNSSAYKELRLRHKRNDIPEFCESCYR
jgi:radical SAM protein with 4Fe4S-binding SPASM domain